MLDHDNGFAVFLIQFLQHLIDTVRMGGIKLGDGFVEDQDIRA